MDTKTCSMCNIGKHINNFYKKHSECKACNCARRLERYYDNKDKLSNQQKKYIMKTIEKKHYYRKTTRDVHKLKF